MTQVQSDKVGQVQRERSRSRLARAWDSDLAYSFRNAPVALISLLVVLVLVLAALLAPLIAPHNPFDPATLNLMNGFTPPGQPNAFTGEFFMLGTDDQGRDVLAVPGHPFDARASGANILIRDGATLVRGAEDVLEVLNTLPLRAPKQPDIPQDSPTNRPNRSLRDTAALHSEILQRLGPSPISEDQLSRDMVLSPSEVTPALLDLEMHGKITRLAGGLLSKT